MRIERATGLFAMVWGVAFLLGSASADTVYFKDGTTLDGTVSQPNANCYALQIGNGRMTFPVQDVLRVEKNDKQGSYDLNTIRAKRHNDIMLERTGLTREQRDAVRKLVSQLDQSDPRIRGEARAQLVRMSKEMPIAKYLNACMPYIRGTKVPEMMEIVVELDPAGAERMLMIRSQDLSPLNRAKALELIGATMKDKGAERVAQGMLDHDPSIQIAAANTLGSIGDRRASQALVAGLSSADEQVKRASQNALSKVWSTETTLVNFDTAAEWKDYVAARADSVTGMIDPGGLQPLIIPDPEEGIREYVDE